jgi:hypothetical protein
MNPAQKQTAVNNVTNATGMIKRKAEKGSNAEPKKIKKLNITNGSTAVPVPSVQVRAEAKVPVEPAVAIVPVEPVEPVETVETVETLPSKGDVSIMNAITDDIMGVDDICNIFNQQLEDVDVYEVCDQILEAKDLLAYMEEYGVGHIFNNVRPWDAIMADIDHCFRGYRLMMSLNFDRRTVEPENFEEAFSRLTD